MKLLILIAIIIYVLSPIDLIPDYIGPLGRLDELALLVLAWHHLRGKSSDTFTGEAAHEKDDNTQRTTSNHTSRDSQRKPSPHVVLGVPETASAEEIEKAYRSLAIQYHPDKVEHLGADLRAVAHEKMIQLTAAYEALSGKR